MPRLVHTENGVSREYPLGDTVITVGRAGRNTIPTMDPRASREHFRIQLSGGRYVVSDTGSRNGTLLNGDPLKEPRPLSIGDRLTIGSALFQFLEGDAAPTSAPPILSGPPSATENMAGAAAQIDQTPRLIRMPEGASEESWPVTTTGIAIGRGKGCDVVVNDEKLSNRHFEVSLIAEGVVLKDLKSTNGTKVKEERIESVVLRDGEKFWAGASYWRVADPRNPQDRDATPAPAAAAAPGGRKVPVAVIAAVGVVAILGGVAAFAPAILKNFVKVPPKVEGPEGNLLGQAGSFEDPAMSAWKIETTARVGVEADAGQKKDGALSMKIRGLDSRQDSMTRAVSAIVPIESAAAFRLSGWVRGSGLTGVAGLRLEWMRGQEMVGATPTDLRDGTFEWKELRVAAAPPPGADGVRAACVVAGQVALTWFDGITLTRHEGTVPGARWNTAWGVLSIDEALFIRAESPEGPLFWNGELRFLSESGAVTPLWAGVRDGEPQSVGNGYRAARSVQGDISCVLVAVHATEEDDVTWKPVAPEGTSLILTLDLAPGAATSLTTRSGELLEPRDGDFRALTCSEIVFGTGPSISFDSPVTVALEGTRLTLTWAGAAETIVRFKRLPTWLEREVRTLVSDANAAYKAGDHGRAYLLYQEVAKRFSTRPEAREAETRASELRMKAVDAVAAISKEAELYRKYTSALQLKKVRELIAAVETGFAGTEWASQATAIGKSLESGPPDENGGGTSGTDPVVKPPEKEPVENARRLLEWAEAALAKEEFLKAEIYARNVLERWPGTAEEISAGELLGRVTSGAKAAKERDAWIRETLTKARNLVRNNQPEKAVPLFEEALKRYPGHPLLKGVPEELAKLK